MEGEELLCKERRLNVMCFETGEIVMYIRIFENLRTIRFIIPTKTKECLVVHQGIHLSL